MAKNPGKLFEEDILASVPDKYFKYKLRDSAAAWGGGTKTRFTTNNICDVIVHDSIWLHLWELKSHGGNSFPLTIKRNAKGTITNYGVIKRNQVDGLMNEYNKKNVEPGFIFNLRDKEKTFFVSIKWVYMAIYEDELKSLNLKWLELHGMLIPQQKRPRSKIHYVYDLSALLEELKKGE